MKWLIRGDCHGAFTWLDNLDKEKYPPEETAIIILGDAGFNFFLNKTDEKMKTWINERGYYIYCVRGNHEQRPQLCPMIDEIWDENRVVGNAYTDSCHGEKQVGSRHTADELVGLNVVPLVHKPAEFPDAQGCY